MFSASDVEASFETHHQYSAVSIYLGKAKSTAIQFSEAEANFTFFSVKKRHSSTFSTLSPYSSSSMMGTLLFFFQKN